MIDGQGLDAAAGLLLRAGRDHLLEHGVDEAALVLVRAALGQLHAHVHGGEVRHVHEEDLVGRDAEDGADGAATRLAGGVQIDVVVEQGLVADHAQGDFPHQAAVGLGQGFRMAAEQILEEGAGGFLFEEDVEGGFPRRIALQGGSRNRSEPGNLANCGIAVPDPRSL
jgi:hypothetical protein